MTEFERVPAGVDASRPSIARVYDCLLGGEDNYVVDRALFAQVLMKFPDAPRGAHDNRGFLWRVVHFLAAEAGIRQFIDVGPGLPTRGNVHEAVRDAGVLGTVVYVDNDPEVVAHGTALLEGDTSATIIAGDIRRPEEVLASPAVRRVTESGEPFALLLFGILHHICDHEDPAGIAARLRQALSAGSYLAISHFQHPGYERPDLAVATVEGEEFLARTLGSGRWRTREEILSYFGDLDLVEPGLVPLSEWRPNPHACHHQHAGHNSFTGGVARRK